VATHVAYRPTNLLDGKWNVVSPQTADRVSAVAYYFARKVEQETHIPIGLVLDNVGGTPAEAWTSAEALRPLNDFEIPLAEVQGLATSGAPEYGNYVNHWYDEYDLGQKQNWSAPGFDDSTWKTVTVPGGFSELGVLIAGAEEWRKGARTRR
jgi:sialate O-acetylesterase